MSSPYRIRDNFMTFEQLGIRNFFAMIWSAEVTFVRVSRLLGDIPRDCISELNERQVAGSEMQLFVT